MRGIVCVLTILLGGCYGVSPFERPTLDAGLPIMSLWERYQQCLVTTDSGEFVFIIDQFEQVRIARAEPPSWLGAWGRYVMSQPLRTAVDPQALGVACTLRAAAVMAEAERLTEARALYQRVLVRYSSSDWTYYVEQAKQALVSLSDPTHSLVAFRSDRAVSH